MDLIQKRVLVTGAGGFIGSHLVEKLVSLGARVRCFVRYRGDGGIGELENLSKEILEKIEIVRGDLKNVDSVKRAIKNIEVVFHLGALIAIPYSYEDPRDFIETNVLGTLNILRNCQEENVEKIIITSTSEVYGTAIYSPIDEKHPLQPQSPYSASKIAADNIALSFYRTYNLPVTIIRPFNTFGPRQSTRAVIPTIITQALTKDSIKLGSLSPKRDFNFVEDTVEGFIKIAESDNSEGKVINIGSGKTISIGGIIEIIKKIMGKDFIVETDEERIRPEKSEVGFLLCDNTKAKNILGWEPKNSFEEGLHQTIHYIQQNLGKYNPGEYSK